MITKPTLRRIAMVFAAAVVAVGLASQAASTAAVTAPQQPAMADQVDQFACWIHTHAEARIEVTWTFNPADGSFIAKPRLAVDIKSDIHNPMPFSGCSIDVQVKVITVGGVVIATPTHRAFAGAVFDPQGSDKWYGWTDYPALDLASTVGMSLQISHFAAS